MDEKEDFLKTEFTNHSSVVQLNVTFNDVRFFIMLLGRRFGFFFLFVAMAMISRARFGRFSSWNHSSNTFDIVLEELKFRLRQN